MLTLYSHDIARECTSQTRDAGPPSMLFLSTYAWTHQSVTTPNYAVTITTDAWKSQTSQRAFETTCYLKQIQKLAPRGVQTHDHVTFFCMTKSLLPMCHVQKMKAMETSLSVSHAMPQYATTNLISVLAHNQSNLLNMHMTYKLPGQCSTLPSRPMSGMTINYEIKAWRVRARWLLTETSAIGVRSWTQ